MDKVAKFKFTLSNNNSIAIKIVKMFLRLSITPNKPMKNTVAASPKTKFILIVIMIISLGIQGFEPWRFGLKVRCSTN